MLLEALASGSTQHELARRCRVDRGQIKRLVGGVPAKNGTPTDSYELRRALERYLAIPLDAWDVPPVALVKSDQAPDVERLSDEPNNAAA